MDYLMKNKTVMCYLNPTIKLIILIFILTGFRYLSNTGDSPETKKVLRFCLNNQLSDRQSKRVYIIKINSVNHDSIDSTPYEIPNDELLHDTELTFDTFETLGDITYNGERFIEDNIVPGNSNYVHRHWFSENGEPPEYPYYDIFGNKKIEPGKIVVYEMNETDSPQPCSY